MRVGPAAEDATSRYVRARAALLRHPPSGGAGRRALASRTDALLATLFRGSGAATTGAVLAAVGGLGRRELAPGSDLDLLLLHPADADTDAVTRAADRLWYPLWDNGFRLDHSVRNPAQARRLAAQDLRVVLGLLDARPLAGDAQLLTTLRESVLADWRAFARDRLPELHANVQERAARSGELAHLLEPDLKESHGGLRDLVALRAVAASWVTDAPLAGLSRPHTLLLDVRDALHVATGRPGHRLHLQEQTAVAGLLGLADDDALLRAVSAAGRTVAVASDAVWHRVSRLQRPSRAPDPRRVRRPGSGRPVGREPLDDDVVVQDGEVVLAMGARPERDAVLVLRAAAAAAQSGRRLAPHAVDRLGSRSAAMPEPWPRAARDALVSLLGAGRAAVPVWEALDQVDVWSRLLPGWSEVRSAPQRNPVHRFTVDRHLVETAAAAAPMLREVSRPDLLLVGALLHDIGKGRGGDHSATGMQVVADLAPRLGYGADDADTLVRLVEHHLLLPEVATRRDLADPATIAAVAAAVRTPEFLDLLHALTRADAQATGPAAWSDWKQALVADLVGRTRAALGLPVRSRAATPDPGDLAPMLASAGSSQVQVVWQERDTDSVAQVVVAAPDRVGLLAVVAGVLSLHRLQVRAARVDTVPVAGAQRAVQAWTVEPVFGGAPPVERLREDVGRALRGQLDLAARLRSRDEALRSAAGAEPPPPVVAIVPGASARASVLEVRAHDAPGLLHDLARALADCGVTVVSAQVSTLGSEVVDVFYVVDADGFALAPDRQDVVCGEVLDAITRRET